jgi:hypothetical protein
MAGGGGDHDAVGFVGESGVDDRDLPAGHLADVVATLANTAAVCVAGGSAFAVAGDVIDMADRRPAIRVTARLLIAQLDQLSEPALEAAAAGIPTHSRAGWWPACCCTGPAGNPAAS